MEMSDKYQDAFNITVTLPKYDNKGNPIAPEVIEQFMFQLSDEVACYLGEDGKGFTAYPEVFGCWTETGKPEDMKCEHNAIFQQTIPKMRKVFIANNRVITPSELCEMKNKTQKTINEITKELNAVAKVVPVSIEEVSDIIERISTDIGTKLNQYSIYSTRGVVQHAFFPSTSSEKGEAVKPAYRRKSHFVWHPSENEK